MYNPQSNIARVMLDMMKGLPPAKVARSLRAARSENALPPNQAGDWRARTIAIYQQASREDNAIRTAFAAQVLALTGGAIAPESIYVDRATGVTTGVVDGVVFQSRHDRLSLLRPCVHCGVRLFESPPLYSPGDVGYALNAWQPLCKHCQAEDPLDWPYWDGEDLNGDP
jgi:hypothetical protein